MPPVKRLEEGWKTKEVVFTGRGSNKYFVGGRLPDVRDVSVGSGEVDTGEVSEVLTPT